MKPVKKFVPKLSFNYFNFQGDFLQNLRHIDFGIRYCGTTVGDVDLPPWAKSHADFVEKLRDELNLRHDKA